MTVKETERQLIDVIIGDDAALGNNVKLHRGASGLQAVPGTDATADGVDSVAASRFIFGTVTADPSFSLTTITGGAATVKAGALRMPDGTELNIATDLSVNLKTEVNLSGVATGGSLGSAAATTQYYLYVDVTAAGALQTDTNTGRQFYTVAKGTAGAFVVLPTTPQQVNQQRYIALASVKTDGSAAFVTAGMYSYTYKETIARTASVNATTYRLAKQAVGAVGTSGQVAAGHLTDTRSFPAGISAANRSWYNLAANATDGSGNARALAPVGSSSFASAGILGTDAAAVLDGATVYQSTDTFYNAGNNDHGTACWIYAADWTPTATTFFFMSSVDGGVNAGWYIFVNPDGSIAVTVRGSTTATDTTQSNLVYPAFTDGSWHHFAFTYQAAGKVSTLYIDGKAVATITGQNLQSMPSGNLTVGGTVGAGFGTAKLTGRLRELAYAKGSVSADDVRKLYAYGVDHNKGLAAGLQIWSGNLYATSTGLASQDNQSWLVDKSDNNRLFVDFSDMGSTDQAELALADGGFSAVNLPLMRYDSGLLSALPTFPITHGLGEVPTEVVIQYEVNPNEFDFYSAQGNVSATLSQLIGPGSLSLLTINASHRIRIMAFVGASASAAQLASKEGLQVRSQLDHSFSIPAGTVAFWPGDLDLATFNLDVQGTLIVEGQIISSTGALTGPGTVRSLNVLDASTSTSGLLNNARQSVFGLKGFLGGSYSAGAFVTFGNGGTLVLTQNDNRHQVVNLLAANALLVPNQGVTAGEIFTIQNLSGAFDLTIKSNNGLDISVANGSNMDASIRNGSVRLMALQTNPDTPLHWRVLDVTETYSFTGTFVHAGDFSPTATVVLARNNGGIVVRVNDFTTAGVLTTNSIFTASAALPARFRPAAGTNTFMHAIVRNGGSQIAGAIAFQSSGDINVYRDYGGGANFTTGFTAGLGQTSNSQSWAYTLV